jgi:putative ATP-dependent endonuclease of the OLD family
LEPNTFAIILTMKIVRLEIKNFRGIKNLDWTINGNFICLVGSGDTGKSTILDAIEVTLSPRWNLQLDDTDFHQAETIHPIMIDVTLVDPPKELLTEMTFGLHKRGWNTLTGLSDEPESGDADALTVRFTVDQSLEPRWSVVTDRDVEGVKISAKQRETLGVSRIDAYLDRHLTWGRGTVLSRLTDKGGDEGFVDAVRAARDVVRKADLADLKVAAGKVEERGRSLGATTNEGLRPNLDAKYVQVGSGGLSLHDGAIPVRLKGLGTRRLFALAAQDAIERSSGVTLIDEIEHGLEPYRVRHLIRSLRNASNAAQSAQSQVFFSTHSSVAVQEAEPTEIHIVRNKGGVVAVHCLSDENLRTTIRLLPESLLAKKIIVCEGITEIGFLQAFDESWAREVGGCPLAILGVVPVDGDGDNVPARAKRLSSLGYQVAIFADSDTHLPQKRVELAELGVEMFLWPDGSCIENAVVGAVSWTGVRQLLRVIVDQQSEVAVRDGVASRFGSVLPDDIDSWTESPKLRDCIARTAAAKGWFKSTHLGAALGRVAVAHMPPSAVATATMTRLRDWTRSL